MLGTVLNSGATKMSRKGGVRQWKQYCLKHTGWGLNANSDTNCTFVGKGRSGSRRKQ